MSENEKDNEKDVVETSVTADTEATEQPVVSADTAETNSDETSVTSSDGAAAVATKKPKNKFLQKLDDFFGIGKAGSNFKTEIIGGLITFMAMVYILPVNANMFSNDVGGLLGVSFGAIYIATAISAVVGTLLMAFLARLPMAQASGMGLNAFFVFTICLGLKLTYANALILVLVDGILFILLTVTGLRKRLFEAIPKTVRIAIPAGIGLFIAFIGMKNAGLIVDDIATLVKLASFNLLDTATYGSVMPLIITILGIIAVAIMSKKGVKGAILWSMLGATALYWAFMGIGYNFDALSAGVIDGFGEAYGTVAKWNPINAFKDWGVQSVGQVFASGFDFSDYLAIPGNNGGSLALVIITSSLAFCMVDLFDTMGTLYGACARGNMLKEDGSIPNMNKAMLCDAIATTTGAICGTSTVTTFVESSSGIGTGARTGLASVMTAACFVVAMFLSPIAAMIPSCATSIALIYVGVLMMNCVREIEWTDVAEAVPAFLTIAMMPLTYNISYGIAFGIISWLLIRVVLTLIDLAGRKKKGTVEPAKAEEKIHIVTVVIAVLFILMFFLTH